ncbi:hypothetical protein [Gymnodinialimonas hymeniacidonis]|uniref:glycine-rich domain-containing protein n=1 Tax=Gymnodinialimonas hymeniacidonis TaxID=3126508 RepID=UPI0034C618A3
MRNPELWARLSAFEFDKGPGSAPYSVKLARAEGWSAHFTARVIEEYRRFLYLTQVSDRQVTPSQIVDAAWHMHLTFTRDYWEDLCPNVIGKPVHHQPCAGEEVMPRYRDQFAATKALYEAEFGEEPPADIWARNHVRTARGFAVEESGSITSSPAFIAFWPFAISLVLTIVDYSHLIALIALGTGIIFFMVLLNPRRRRKQRTRTERDGDLWIEDDYDSSDPSDRRDGGSSSSGSGRSSSSKHSRDDNDKSSSGGFWAMFGGDGDSDGGGGGGCGGCGGGD